MHDRVEPAQRLCVVKDELTQPGAVDVPFVNVPAAKRRNDLVETWAARRVSGVSRLVGVDDFGA
jgi:hypothetical protein